VCSSKRLRLNWETLGLIEAQNRRTERETKKKKLYEKGEMEERAGFGNLGSIKRVQDFLGHGGRKDRHGPREKRGKRRKNGRKKTHRKVQKVGEKT